MQKRAAFLQKKMLTPHAPGLALKLVMLIAAKPKDLIDWTLVCKNWRDELRKDEYWYKFRQFVLDHLPSLREVFESPTPTAASGGGGGGGKRLWSIFVHRLWPLARNLHKTAMQPFKIMNAHVLTAVLDAYLPILAAPAEQREWELLHPTPLTPHVFGAIRLHQAQDVWSFVFKSEALVARETYLPPDENLLQLKKLAGKSTKQKTVRVVCSISKNRKFTRYVPLRQFFAPYLARVFCKSM